MNNHASSSEKSVDSEDGALMRVTWHLIENTLIEFPLICTAHSVRAHREIFVK